MTRDFQQTPLVSVLMGVLNGAPFVERAVRSILDQTMRSFELIIVDDGSTDDTWQILTRLADMDPRIVLLRNKENQGLPRTANKGISHAKGKFLARQDADDWSYPERLETQLNFLEENREHVAIGSGMLVVNENGLPIRLWMFPHSHEEIDFLHLNGYGLQMPHPAMMARLDAIRDAGGYREQFFLADDYELALRLAEIGKIGNVEDILVRYTKHPGSMTRLNREKWFYFKKKALDDAWQRRGLGIPPFSTLPNPSVTRKSEGSRAVSLALYGLKKILQDPGSREGWSSLKGALARTLKKWGD